MSAAEAGHFEVAEFLIDAGAEVNLPSFTSNETPLIAAAKGCHTDIVEYLIEAAGADFDIDRQAFDHGRTALITAALNNCTDTVEVLAAGADLDIQQRMIPQRRLHSHVNTRTALIIAVRNENIEIVRILADAGANLDLRDYSYDTEGETAWMIAYDNDNTAIMNILRSAEARNLRLTSQIHVPKAPQGISGIVLSLLESDMTVEQVSDITGFSNEVIRSYLPLSRPYPFQRVDKDIFRFEDAEDQLF